MKKIIYSAFALGLALLTFASCEDVPMPYEINYGGNGGNTATTAPMGDGTQASPYNVAAADSIITAGSQTEANVYIRGIVSKINDIDTGSYGNATYFISDTGSETGQLEVYRGYYLGGEKFTSASQLNVGDTVVVLGALVNFNSTHEVAQRNQLYSINGKTVAENTGGTTTPTAEATGEGTEASPYNVAKVLELYANNSYDANKEVYVKGKVSKVGSIDTGSYGNATYYISDDGTSNNDFEIYRGFYLNGEKFTSADQLKVGQTVVVCGKLTLYNTTKEMAQGSKLISIDGEGTSTGGNTGETTTGNFTISGTTITATNAAVTAGSTTVTIDLTTAGFADKGDATTVTLSDGSTLTFAGGSNTSNTPKYYAVSKGVRMYANNTITIEGKATIAKVVFTCDAYNGTDYVGNATQTFAFNGSKFVWTNTHSEDKGGVQLRVQTITITYAN